MKFKAKIMFTDQDKIEFEAEDVDFNDGMIAFTIGDTMRVFPAQNIFEIDVIKIKEGVKE